MYLNKNYKRKISVPLNWSFATSRAARFVVLERAVMPNTIVFAELWTELLFCPTLLLRGNFCTLPNINSRGGDMG